MKTKIKLTNTTVGQTYTLNEVERMLLDESVDYNSNCEVNSNFEFEVAKSFIQIWDNKVVVYLVCENTEPLFKLIYKHK